MASWREVSGGSLPAFLILSLSNSLCWVNVHGLLRVSLCVSKSCKLGYLGKLGRMGQAHYFVKSDHS